MQALLIALGVSAFLAPKIELGAAAARTPLLTTRCHVSMDGGQFVRKAVKQSLLTIELAEKPMLGAGALCCISPPLFIPTRRLGVGVGMVIGAAFLILKARKWAVNTLAKREEEMRDLNSLCEQESDLDICMQLTVCCGCELVAWEPAASAHRFPNFDTRARSTTSTKN